MIISRRSRRLRRRIGRYGYNYLDFSVARHQPEKASAWIRRRLLGE